jgi:hypothetical protein
MGFNGEILLLTGYLPVLYSGYGKIECSRYPHRQRENAASVDISVIAKAGNAVFYWSIDN